MKLFYTAVVTSALFSSTVATADNDRELMGMKLFVGDVESTEEATFNVDDMANEDDFDSLEATDKVKVLIKKISEDVVFPTSFGLSLDLPEHNIVAGTMTREDYESIKDDSNIIVEIDREVGVLEKNHVTNLRRKLAENTPYGISMVLQEMNFWSKLGEPSGAIKVCVADTGYDLGHEDTPKGDDVTGTDNPEYSSDSWNKDPHGHGTHCSGTVSALGGNDKGVVGVIPNNAGEKFQLVIANALMGSGSGSWAGVIAGVDTCVSNGAKVVSLSLGGYFYSAITEEYYKDLYEKQGILFVAAAGNGGNTNKLYPASYPSLMSVAAIDSNKNKASFSTFNDQVEISAPGVSIESSLPGNTYAKWSGTSMATPHVAGVAGLLWMYFPDCKNYQIRNAILATAEDLRTDGCDIETGFGVVRAKSAYELLAKGNCGGNLGVTDGTVGGCDQLSVTDTVAPTSAPISTDDPKTFAPTTTETIVFAPTSTELPIDDTFAPTATESTVFPPTSTELPIDDTFAPTATESTVFLPTSTELPIDDTFAPTATESTVFPPTSTELPIDDTFAPTTTETAVFPPTSTELPIDDTASPTASPTPLPTAFPTAPPPTSHPTATPPTPHPTNVPPTPHPTNTPPTHHPTETPPTPHPTETPPTPFPTDKPPTPFPTEAPPTSGPENDSSGSPSGSPSVPPKTCAGFKEYCDRKQDCCSNRCNKKKNYCVAPKK